MKNILTLLLSLLILLPVSADNENETEKEVPDKRDHSQDMGRTFYDADNEAVKEIYSYKEVQRFNPEKPEEGITIEEVKEGAYFRYFKNGQLEVMGTFDDGEKHGTFTYFDLDGNKVKIVTYEQGEIIEEVLQE